MKLNSINNSFNQFLFGNEQAPLKHSFLIFFRISISILALIDILSLQSDWHAFFGLNGTIVPQQLSYLKSEYFSYLNPFYNQLKHYQLIDIFYKYILITYVISLISLAIGFLSRFSAVLCLFLQLIIFRSFPVFNFGYDHFITMSLFYCFLFPVGRSFSIDTMIFKWRIKKPFSLPYQRILQIHISIVYFFSGLAKGTDPNWWNGNAVWRATASFYTSFYSYPAFIMCIIGTSVVLLELTYPLFVSIKKTRFYIISGVIMMHCGIAVIMDLHTFAGIMIIWNLTAFYNFDKIYKIRRETPLINLNAAT